MTFATGERLEPRRLLSLALFGPVTTLPVDGSVTGIDIAAASDGRYIVAAHVTNGDTDSIVAVRYAASGGQIGSPLTLESYQRRGSGPFGDQHLSVSINDSGDAVVAFVVPRQVAVPTGIYSARISSTGQASPPKLIAAPRNDLAGFSDDLFTPAVSIDSSGGYFVGWIDDLLVTDDDSEAIGSENASLRAFDAQDQPLADSLILGGSSGDIGSPADLTIAAKKDGSGAVFAFALYNFDNNFSVDKLVYGRTSTSALLDPVNQSLNGWQDSFLIGTPSQAVDDADEPSIDVSDDGSFVVGYRRYLTQNTFFDVTLQAAYAQRFDADGQKLGDPIELGSSLAGEGIRTGTHSVAVSSDGGSGGFMAEFAQTVGDTDTSYARQYDADGKSRSKPIAVASRSSTPLDDSALNHSPAPAIATDSQGRSAISYIDDSSAGHVQRLLGATVYAPDLTFGNGGHADVAGWSQIAPLPDGKIIALGSKFIPGDPNSGDDPGENLLFAWRINADGSIDKTFGDAGSINFREADETFFNGSRIFVIDSFEAVSVLHAYTIDGVPDTSFSDDGMEPVPFRAEQIGNVKGSLVGQTPQGGMILEIDGDEFVNSADSRAFSQLVKLKPDGSVDTSFGNSGFVDMTDRNLNVTPMLTSHGLLFRTGAPDAAKFTRYKSDGLTVDTSFGQNGTVSFPATVATSFELREQPDGKLIVVKITRTSDADYSTTLFRLNVNGSRDNSFGDHGTILLDKNDFAALAFDDQGRIYLNTDKTLYRFSAVGVLDTNSPFNGTFPFVSARTMTFDSAGRLLVGGVDVTRYTFGDPVGLGNDGIVYVRGSSEDDHLIVGNVADGKIDVTFTHEDIQFTASDVKGFNVDLLDGNNSAAILIDVDSTVTGGAGNDNITTEGGDDIVHGGAGDDIISTGAGNDKIFGEAGNDTIAGGDGNDRIFGGGMYSFADELPDNDLLVGNAGKDTLIGGLGADRLYGNGGRDRLYGGGGSDRLYGGASGDWLYGQGGSDQLFGEGGADRLYGDYGLGDDTLHGGAGDDQFVTIDSTADYIFGDSGHDTAEADTGDILTSAQPAA